MRLQMSNFSPLGEGHLCHFFLKRHRAQAHRRSSNKATFQVVRETLQACGPDHPFVSATARLGSTRP